MDTNLQFYIGLACAIPLSIVANLLTRRYERWAEARGVKRSLRRTKRLIEQYEEAKWLAARPQRLTEFLVYTTVKILFNMFVVCALFAATAIGIAYRIKHGVTDIPPHIWWFSRIAGICGAIAALRIPSLLFGLMDVYYRVHHFDSYRKRVEALLLVKAEAAELPGDTD